MFNSFFPWPKLFFSSAFLWFLLALFLWHLFAVDLHSSLNFLSVGEVAEGEDPPFLTAEKLWTYLYITGASAIFCVIWFFIDRNSWYLWSVWGSAFILVFTYFSVQIGVWINNWWGDFFDLIQQALGEPGSVTLAEYNGLLLSAAYVLFPYIIFLVAFSFYNAHYTFRWRVAMNNYYMEHWGKLRNVEGASQRVQEDTMRFADIVENLGSGFIRAVMTLLAFLPLLWDLSKQISEIPFLGELTGSLIYVAILIALFGTVLLGLIGIRLPGLQFNNQKVEAAYRKELVFGEAYEDRAAPPTVTELFGNVRKNYYRIYAEYTYFNFFRYTYEQGASLVPFFILGPTVVVGAITFGVFQQIRNAYSRVENSFQFLVNSWTTIIELLSIHKRLKLFEQAIDGDKKLDMSQFGDDVAPIR